MHNSLDTINDVYTQAYYNIIMHADTIMHVVLINPQQLLTSIICIDKPHPVHRL